jgi:hypothetical protein
MRKSFLTLALAVLTGFSATPAKAFFEANVSGGYTTVAMGEVNDRMSAVTGADVTKISSGYYIAADAGISVFPFIKLVPRVEYIAANQGAVKTTGSSTTIDTNLVPLELGLATDVSLPLTGLSVRGGVWGGYGMATAMTANTVSGVTITNLYQGNAFTAEVLGALRYDIIPLTSLSLELGYRMANIPKMTDSAGNTQKKANGVDDLPFDYSGMNVGLGLSVGF